MQRKQARENAFMLIFESVCKSDETAEEIFSKATELRGLEYDQYVTDVFFGAYENAALLDEKMDIRWFRAATADDPYEYVPQRACWQFNDFEIFREPAFRYRQLTHTAATGKIPFNGQTLAVRQGFQINPPWNYRKIPA